ncbi:MAG: hypothetical protein R6W91_00235 [Thermoplasmata archaeon]
MTTPVDEYINGQVLLSFREFIKKKHGQGGLDQLDKALDFNFRDVVDEGQYPAAYAVDCMNFIQTAYGADALFQAGRFSLQNIGAKRYFTIFLPPKTLLDKLAESVPKVNNSVKLNIEYQDSGAVVTLSNRNLKEVQCKYWHGMLQGVFDLTKTKGSIEVNIARVSKEGKAVYTMKW